MNSAPSVDLIESIHSAAKNVERKFYGNARDADSRRNENTLEANLYLQRGEMMRILLCGVDGLKLYMR